MQPVTIGIVGIGGYGRTYMRVIEALEKEINQGIMNHGEYQITDALQMMIDKGEKFTTYTIDEWFDCGKPEAMLETNRKLLEDAGASVPAIEGCVIVPPVSISPGVEIVNSIVGPYVSIAENAVVHNSIIRDSIIAEGASIRDSLLEASLVGAEAVIQGGFQQVDVGDSSEITFK